MSTLAQPSAAEKIEAYIAAAPNEMQPQLRRMRELIKANAPDAVEVFAYGLPGYRYMARPLLYYGAAARHYALYGNTASAQAALKEDMKGLNMSKGTIRFNPDDPFPETLVRKLVAVRLAEVEAAEVERKAKTRERRKKRSAD